MTTLDIQFVTPAGAHPEPVDRLPALLEEPGAGFVWVDIAEWSERAERLLVDTLHLHPMAVAACRDRNHTPTVHGYPDHVFLVLHGAETRDDGHVHLLELDLFVGRRFLITVHGPLSPEVAPELASRETAAALARIQSGRLRPATPAALAYAVVTALLRGLRTQVSGVASTVAGLERAVMESDLRRPEVLLERMFAVRHQLLTVRTMAVQTSQVCGRAATLARVLDVQDRTQFEDLEDQYVRLTAVADGEKEFVFGVIELYHTRVSTKMTVAMERLAVLAAVTLPITAIASVVGMNVIVHDRTQPVQLLLILLLMAAISGWLLRWTRQQGWW